MAKSKVANVPGVDPTLPRVPVELNGETYFLVFTFGALAIAASELRKLGVEVNLLHSLDLSTFDADKVIPLLYAALITHQRDITLEKVTKLVTLHNLGSVFAAIVKAYTESLAEPNGSDTEGSSPKEAQGS